MDNPNYIDTMAELFDRANHSEGDYSAYTTLKERGLTPFDIAKDKARRLAKETGRVHYVYHWPSLPDGPVMAGDIAAVLAADEVAPVRCLWASYESEE